MKDNLSSLPKCAVLLAVYNGMQYVQEQVKTILQQKEVAITLFVSVDRSSDGSEAWFDTLAAADPRVHILPHGEKFGGASRNFFRLIRDVSFAEFDYIAFADQDDIWDLDKLSRAVSVLQWTACEGYSGNVIAFWPDGRRKQIHKAQPQKKWDYIFESAGPGCTFVMTRTLMNAIKARLQTVWEAAQHLSLHDWYCYAFARANGYAWYIDETPKMQYRQHGQNEFGVNTGVRAYWQRLKKIREGWWFTQACLIDQLVNEQPSHFVQSWNQMRTRDLLRLSLSAFQCRRRLKEQVLFLIICMIFAMMPFKENHETSR